MSDTTKKTEGQAKVEVTAAVDTQAAAAVLADAEAKVAKQLADVDAQIAEKVAAAEKVIADKLAEAEAQLQAAHAKMSEAEAEAESLLATKGGEAPKGGLLVKEGDLVSSAVGDYMVDSVTMEKYDTGVWKEAKPSAWLDAQVKAGKIAVK